jgi:hypothetical protein
MGKIVQPLLIIVDVPTFVFYIARLLKMSADKDAE